MEVIKFTIEKSEMETVAETVPLCEEVTVTKTEVKEEPFDYETTDAAAELWDAVKEEVDPLSCVAELADKTDDLKSFDVVKKEEPDKATFASNFCRNWKEQLAKKLKTGPGVGVCSFCKMEFFDQQSFGEHLASCKNNIPRLNQTKNGDNCNVTQKNAPGHSKEKRFSCPNCARSFYQKFSLTCHINMIHLDERRYKCDSCGYATVFKHSLENHVLAMHSDSEKKYRCKSCDYSSKFKGSLALHMRSHSDEKPFKCTYRICKCGSSQKGKPCKCDRCSFASAYKQALKRHMLLKHTESPKKYKCTYKKCECASQDESCECATCNFSTAYKKGLERHMVVRHNREPKAHTCAEKKCKHTRSEEKRCVCKPCDFVTTRECSLRRHVLARHSNAEKRYKCGKCWYLAYRKESLVNHFRRHHLSDISN